MSVPVPDGGTVHTRPVPDYPPEAVTAIARELGRQCHGGPPDESDLKLAADVLAAAAPVLAEACARKILAHMEAHGPQPAAPGLTLHATLQRAWRRHFGIAARVAAGAFDTREDQLRMTAEAIERGNFIACNIPEVPREP